ncbi:hypothetical protein [Amycolatopsis xylanica]|uniref:hypothetical protein n=1 Tax=Amycolatopsis xylanica TaxID=589385 RepID=UPI000B88E4F0|nr:hypothetical protein [Amycolatopsis xylanica]
MGQVTRARCEGEAARSLVCSLDLGEAEAPLLGWIARLHLCDGDETTAALRMAELERTPWWRSNPEAVAWMAECQARQCETQAEGAAAARRGELAGRAAALYGKAADGLARAGLAVHAVRNRCRQAIQLARGGFPYRETLLAAAEDAARQGDPRASALVRDAAGVIESCHDR